MIRGFFSTSNPYAQGIVIFPQQRGQPNFASDHGEVTHRRMEYAKGECHGLSFLLNGERIVRFLKISFPFLASKRQRGRVSELPRLLAAPLPTNFCAGPDIWQQAPESELASP